MQERQLFEYAAIRLVPQVEREEFLNVGVIVYCGAQQFLQMRYHLDQQKLAAFCKQECMEEAITYLDIFARICAGDEAAGGIGRLNIAERFRWLTSTRSTIVQVSRVHPGFCKDPGEQLQSLFESLVL